MLSLSRVGLQCVLFNLDTQRVTWFTFLAIRDKDAQIEDLAPRT